MRLSVLLAWLVLWPSLAVGQDNVPTDIFRETWATLRTSSGISGSANVDITPWGATPRDSAYPAVGLTDSIKVVFRNGQNVLTSFNETTDWNASGVIWDRIGSVAGIHANYPNWYDASVELTYYADYYITTAALDDGPYGLVVWLTRGVGSFPVTLSIDTAFGYTVDFFCQRWNQSNINVSSASTSRAALENKHIRFQIKLKPGTMNAPATAVLNDGFVTASMINLDTMVETVFYDYQNTSPWVSFANQGSIVPANNHLNGIMVGYAGLIGENRQVAILSEAVAPTTPPEVSIEENSSTVCQGDTAPTGEATPGEILAAVDPNWRAVCGSGGEFLSAADLTDAEDWDQ